MDNLFESDSLVLYNDGSFKKYYLYGFHDELNDNIISGKWKKIENRLILKPEFQLNDKNEIIRDYKGSHSEIIFEVKSSNKIRYRDNWPNRKIRKLEKK